jgi:uncharacterized protein (DUF305 family)
MARLLPRTKGWPPNPNFRFKETTMKTFRNILAAALALVSGCSVQEAENQTAATSNEVTPAEGNMAGMANDPKNPFAEAEMQMHERMMAAPGANASETWVKKMIEHHRGAVAMSSVLIGLGGEEPALGMARKIVADQGKEIEELERLVQAGGIGAGTTGDADPYKPSDKTMHDRMMAAAGATPSETWIRKMIEHHRGAVDMSNILIAQGGDAKVLEKARATVSSQQKEIDQLEQMLGGGVDLAGSPPAAGAPGSSTSPAPEATPRTPKPKAEAETQKAAPEATPKAAPKVVPKAEPKAALKTEPKAAAAPPTCSAEHRALGHC